MRDPVIAPPVPQPSQPPSAQAPRLSDEFYASPPAYSLPPLPSLPPVPLRARPSAQRRVLSALLFVVLFVPAVALLAKVVVSKYDAGTEASAVQSAD